MSRRTGWFVFAICIAVPLVCAILPGTGWAVKNHVRILLTGHSRPQDGSFAWQYPPLGSGRNAEENLAYLLDCETDTIAKAHSLLGRALAGEPDARLCCAYLQVQSLPGQNPVNRRIESSRSREMIEFEAEEARRRQAKYGGTWEAMILVAKRGMTAEPQNAFFPLVAARLESALGHDEESKHFLEIAASCTAFNDRRAEFQDLVDRALEAEYGYRGALAKLAEHRFVCSANLLGGLPYDVARMNDRKAALDLISCARNIYSTASEPTDLMVAKQLLTNLLPPLDSHQLSGLRTADRIRVRATAFDPSPAFGQTALEFNAAQAWSWVSEQRRIERQSLFDRITDESLTDHYPFVATAILMGIGVAAAFAALAWGIGRIPWDGPPAAALPALCACVWCLIDAVASNGSSHSEMLLPLGLAYIPITIACWFERFRNWAFALGFVAPIVAIGYRTDFTFWGLADNGGPYEAVPLIIFAVLLGLYFWRRKRDVRSSGYFISAFALTSAGWLIGENLFMDISWAPFRTWQFVAALPVFWFLVVSAWQSTSFAEAGRRLGKPLPFVVALGAVAYGVAVFLDVTSDAHAREDALAQQNSAIQARAWAHEHWRDRDP